MPLSRLNLPSFSLVLTTAEGSTVLRDFYPALHREVRLQLLPAPPTSAPPVGDQFLTTVDTRFSGQLAYKVTYADDDASNDDVNAAWILEPKPASLFVTMFWVFWKKLKRVFLWRKA